MSLFTNPNFIVHIIRSQGGHEYFGEETWLLLQALVELETRKMLETAAKFMRNDRRDVILPEDMDLALSHLGHNDIILAREMAHYRIDGTQALREDPAFQSVEELFRQELKSLGNTVFEEPALKGSWIYIKGKIPSTNENIKLKCLADMRTSKAHEKEEKKKVFNIFKDDPISLMTKEQLDYFQKVTAQISAGTLETGFRVHGNLLNMVPFFLKFLTSMEINQASITFVRQLIDNEYVEKHLDYYANQFLAILLAYKGVQSFEAGIKLAEIVKRFSDKYPHLLDIYDRYQDSSYSTVIKRIAFELVVGQPVPISESFLSRCKAEAESNNTMAILCMRLMLMYWIKISSLRQLLVDKERTAIYWLPCGEMKQDPYMNMMF